MKSEHGLKIGSHEYYAYLYAKDPSASKDAAMKWRKENPDLYKEYQRKYRQQWIIDNKDKADKIEIRYQQKKRLIKMGYFIKDENKAFKLTAETPYPWISEQNYKALTEAQRVQVELNKWYVLVESSLGYFTTNEKTEADL
jgi:hypothetical protein